MQRKQGISNDIRVGIGYVGGLIQKVYFSFSSNISDTIFMYTNLMDIKRDNRELLKKINLLQAKTLTYDELIINNKKLRQLIDFKEKFSSELLPANVIAYNLLIETNSTIRIDKGLNHGLNDNFSVISKSGLDMCSKPILVFQTFYSSQIPEAALIQFCKGQEPEALWLETKPH